MAYNRTHGEVDPFPGCHQNDPRLFMRIGRRSDDLRDDSRLAVQLQPLVINPAGNAPVKKEERLIRYILQSQLRVLCQRMLSRQDDEKPFFKKDFRFEIRQINRWAEESNIDFQFPK